MKRRAARRGLTLVELLVVVAIVALLSGFVITYSGVSRNEVALYVEDAKIGQFVLRAKSLSITTRRQELTVPCGYGVRFDYANKQYFLFSYTLPHPLTSLTNPCDAITSISPQSQGYSDVVSSTLASTLAFFNGAQRVDYVFFLPPDPKTMIWVDGKGTPTSGSGSIYIGTADGVMKITLTVTPAGQVNF